MIKKQRRKTIKNKKHFMNQFGTSHSNELGFLAILFFTLKWWEMWVTIPPSTSALDLQSKPSP